MLDLYRLLELPMRRIDYSSGRPETGPPAVVPPPMTFSRLTYETRLTPSRTRRPPSACAATRRSPKASTAMAAVKTGMRFRKIAPPAAPRRPMPALPDRKAAPSAPTPTAGTPGGRDAGDEVGKAAPGGRPEAADAGAPG